ncbi:MAG: hypothetical protein U5J83_18125 [Bryobacterales bacterium]|nr:hypothetical protein [Bryobacterales bacterium]
MASKPVELPISSWAPPESPLRIEYSNEVMEEIRARAVEGFYRLTRGGVEIAGLLLGSVQPDSIRVLAQLPFEIEYAYGPVFALSPRDLAYVRKLIEDVSASGVAENPQARPYRVLGLYVSHSRSGVALSEAEVSLFQQLLPHAWQTVLVLKPSRSPETAAAFFVRDKSGEIRTGQTYGHFAVAPAMGERRSRPPRPADGSLQALAEAARRASDEKVEKVASVPAAPVSRPQAPAASSPLTEEDLLARRAIGAPTPAIPPPLAAPPATRPPEPPAAPPAALTVEASVPRSEEAAPAPLPAASLALAPAAAPEWHEEELPNAGVRATSWLRWAIPSVGLLLLLVLGFLVYHALNSAPPTVVFYTQDSGDLLEVKWQLRGFSDARSAVITVTTGDEVRRIDLIRTGQLSGTYRDSFLQRTSHVALDVERATGELIHRTAPLVPADSVVAYLGSAATPDSGMAVAENSQSAAPAQESETQSAATPDIALAVRSPEPILATPVEPAPRPSVGLPPAPAGGIASIPVASPPVAESRAGSAERLPSPREELELRRTMASPESSRTLASPETSRPAAAKPSTSAPVPEAPVQARMTEAPAPARTDTRQPGPSQAATLPRTVATPSPAVSAPAANPAVRSPAVQIPPPGPAIAPPSVALPKPAAAKPAATRIAAGRMIWTGQLRKNQTLQITGNNANSGVVSAGLPGQPIRVNVLPGELTPQGLVVYTANPRYRDAKNAVEAPGPTNGWNQTRYRYDPARANSLIVTATPSAANGWQGVTVRNDSKNTDVVVIDWQAAEP